MPRARYPSDEARKKQRPHVKIHLSCRSHERYGQVFDDLEARAIVWGLWFLGVQYFATRTGNRLSLGQGDLVWLTGRAEWAHGLRALRAVCARMKYAVTVEGRRVVVEVRNLQRKQGLHSADGGATPLDSAPSEERKNRGTEERNTEERKNGGAARSGRGKTRAPEELSPADAQRVGEYFADVSPGYIAPRLPALIEEALLYFGDRGEPHADWALAVIKNIVSRENAKRERAGEPLLPTRAQARATAKRRAEESAARAAAQPEATH